MHVYYLKTYYHIHELYLFITSVIFNSSALVPGIKQDLLGAGVYENPWDAGALFYKLSFSLEGQEDHQAERGRQ